MSSMQYFSTIHVLDMVCYLNQAKYIYLLIHVSFLYGKKKFQNPCFKLCETHGTLSVIILHSSPAELPAPVCH